MSEVQDRPKAASRAASAFTPDITGLGAVIEDARRAVLDSDRGPEDPEDYHLLMERLAAAKTAFPPLYRQEFVEPFIAKLTELGAAGFRQVLTNDPTRQRAAGLMLDMAQAILQRSERYRLSSLDAFQEVIGDLYDGFLSAEDRASVKPPDLGVTPPLVKFGNPDSGPYTWPGDATKIFGAHAALVNLPPANALSGLAAWTALGHETAGHDILHADDGLPEEIAAAVFEALKKPNDTFLAQYWSDRIDETASDVLGILNMGPAAGIGLIAYFRGISEAFTGVGALRREGSAGDVHPCDVLRGYLAAAVVRRLSFATADAWADLLNAQTDADAQGGIVLAGRPFTAAEGMASAAAVAEVVVDKRLATLENHALREIQDWRDIDERKVAACRRALTQVATLPETLDGSPIYAAHVVAGATVEGLAATGGLQDIQLLTDRMLALVAAMHKANPVWGPLFVRNPGDLRRDFAYVYRTREDAAAFARQ